MLKFNGFKGYPGAKFVLVELFVEGVHFGEGILPRKVWENLKLLNRPVVRLPDSMIEVKELGDYEGKAVEDYKEKASVVTEASRDGGGSQEGKPQGSEVLSLSTSHRGSVQRVQGDRPKE